LLKYYNILYIYKYRHCGVAYFPQIERGFRTKEPIKPAPGSGQAWGIKGDMKLTGLAPAGEMHGII
jgi:hypothetical protein